MKIGLLAYDLRRNGSGQSRFLINICKGIKKTGNYPVIFGLYIDTSIQNYLKTLDIEYHFLKEIPGYFFNFNIITFRDFLSEKLWQLLVKYESCDVYIVMADECIGVIKYMSKFKTAYITQGDISLLFLNHDFRINRRILSYILEKNLSSNIRKHSKIVSKFDLILANSVFTSNLMAYLYELPIDKVVYPPVDSDVFHKDSKIINSDSNYAMAILRNENDPIFAQLKHLAKAIPLKIIGGGHMEGAENLGYVNDDELRQIYSNATINLSPNTKEYYGYSITEAMSCGTPTIAFNNAGAKELIDNGINGWLASSVKELKKIAIELISSSKDEDMSNNCIKNSKKYSIESSAKQLINYLKEI